MIKSDTASLLFAAMADLAIAAFRDGLDDVLDLSERIRLDALSQMADTRFAQDGDGGTRFTDPLAPEAQPSTNVLVILRPGALLVSSPSINTPLLLIWMQPFVENAYTKAMSTLRPYIGRLMYSTDDIEVLDIWVEAAAEDSDAEWRLRSWFENAGLHSLTDLSFRWVEMETLDVIEDLCGALGNARSLVHFRIHTDGSGVCAQPHTRMWAC